jgi:hypothetical protein
MKKIQLIAGFALFALFAGCASAFCDNSTNFTCCEHDINTTITGSLVTSNTYAALPTDWTMLIVTVLLTLSIYLSYSAWVGMNEANKEY